MTGETLSQNSIGIFDGNITLLLGIGGFAVIVGLYFISTYNRIIGTKNNVDESFSSIDTVLQNRYDLIPNLVEVVKQYASHEAGVLNQVTQMRSKLLSNTDSKASKERFADENTLQMGMRSIFAVAENYPDLKANSNFLELQTQWSEIEDRLQGARRAYNAAVKEMRNKQQMFPSSIVAKMVSIDPYEMFEADEVVRTEKMDAKALFAK